MDSQSFKEAVELSFLPFKHHLATVTNGYRSEGEILLNLWKAYEVQSMMIVDLLERVEKLEGNQGADPQAVFFNSPVDPKWWGGKI